MSAAEGRNERHGGGNTNPDGHGWRIDVGGAAMVEQCRVECRHGGGEKCRFRRNPNQRVLLPGVGSGGHTPGESNVGSREGAEAKPSSPAMDAPPWIWSRPMCRAGTWQQKYRRVRNHHDAQSASVLRTEDRAGDTTLRRGCLRRLHSTHQTHTSKWHPRWPGSATWGQRCSSGIPWPDAGQVACR